MKRKYILLLAGAMLISFMTACKTESKDSASPATPAENAAEENISVAPESSSQLFDVSSKEQLLMEYDGVSLYAVPWDPAQVTMAVRTENTSQKNYIIQFADFCVNNYVLHNAFSLNVDADSENSSSFELADDALKECGIQDIYRIDTKILLLDALTFETIYTSEPVTIRTALSDEQTYDESGELLYEQDGLKLVSKGLVDDPAFGKLWKIYIFNNTDSDLAFESTSLTLNGISLDVLLSITVPKGKRAIADMIIFREDLENSQINEISSLETSVNLLNPETFEVKQVIDGIKLTIPS